VCSCKRSAARGQREPGARTHEIDDRRDVERCQAQAVAAAIAHQAVERLEVHGVQPTHDHEQSPPIVKPAVDERQGLHRGEIGPLGIVDHDEQGAVAAVLLGEAQDDLADDQRIGSCPAALNRRR
jgi:hypothetical protein